MIDLVLNDLNLSLEDGAGILMVRDIWWANLIQVTTNQIRNKVEGVTLGVVTLAVECSKGLDPWTDGSKGLVQTMPRSQNPRTVGMGTLQMEGVQNLSAPQARHLGGEVGW